MMMVRQPPVKLVHTHARTVHHSANVQVVLRPDGLTAFHVLVWLTCMMMVLVLLASCAITPVRTVRRSLCVPLVL